MKIGVLFVSHGSTSRAYLEAIDEIVHKSITKLKTLLGSSHEIVHRVGYLHDIEPRLELALQELLKEKPDIVLIVSLFVVPGRHAGKDVPSMLGVKLGEIKRVDNTIIMYVSPLWPDDRVVDIVVGKLVSGLRSSDNERTHSILHRSGKEDCRQDSTISRSMWVRV